MDPSYDPQTQNDLKMDIKLEFEERNHIDVNLMSIKEELDSGEVVKVRESDDLKHSSFKSDESTIDNPIVKDVTIKENDNDDQKSIKVVQEIKRLRIKIPGERKSKRISSFKDAKDMSMKSKLRVEGSDNELIKKIKYILKKDQDLLTNEENGFLTSHPLLVKKAQMDLQRRMLNLERMEEFEDEAKILEEKCTILANIVSNSKHLICYTGAGISTSASIPDYRGNNGIWTVLRKGQSLDESHRPELTSSQSDPTTTHMALLKLVSINIIKHIVSQNCDGLLLRSGITRENLSEVHGNMYIEVCSNAHCLREYVRNFDVTENTRKNYHKTNRTCYKCGSDLKDSIVHFGEKGKLRYPLNWAGAMYNSDKADTILCIGSSLKVLRRYPWLWCLDRPVKSRPKLIIINLQWTSKDKCATLKIHGKVDRVMSLLMEKLKHTIPKYSRPNDALLKIATPLNSLEYDSKSSKELNFNNSICSTDISLSNLPLVPNDCNNYIKYEPIFKWRQNQKDVESKNDETALQNSFKNEGKKRKHKIGGGGWLFPAFNFKSKKRKLK